MEGVNCACQLSQLAQNICIKQMNKVRPENMADRSTQGPIDQNECRSAKTFGLWQENKADGFKPWPMGLGDGKQATLFPQKQKHKCLVHNQAQNRQVERS
ncbi:hypothetical protein CsSME_00026571 [Camellia sinensis var. sinensis]